jgi:hypothetical protein
VSGDVAVPRMMMAVHVDKVGRGGRVDAFGDAVERRKAVLVIVEKVMVVDGVAVKRIGTELLSTISRKKNSFY